jgi:hypothetical protein
MAAFLGDDVAGKLEAPRVAAVGIALFLAGGPVADVRAVAPESGSGARLLRAAAEFRALALRDFDGALARFATPEARSAWLAWQGELWPTTTTRAGWSFFFGTSVWTATGVDDAAPRVAFYHPWSDVWLLTEWSAPGGAPRLSDAAIVLGDWLRGEGATFELAPAWLRLEAFAPAALARATAEALRGFELASAAAAAGRPLGPADPGLATANRTGAALLLAAAVRSARDLALPRAGEPARLTALRGAAAATLSRVRAGELARLAAAAPETLAATRRAIEALPRFDPRWVPIHALAVDEGRAFVFAGDPADGDLVLSLLYDDSGGDPRLRRVDLLTHSQAYRALYPPETANGPRGP